MLKNSSTTFVTHAPPHPTSTTVPALQSDLHSTVGRLNSRVVTRVGRTENASEIFSLRRVCRDRLSPVGVDRGDNDLIFR